MWSKREWEAPEADAGAVERIVLTEEQARKLQEKHQLKRLTNGEKHDIMNIRLDNIKTAVTGSPNIFGAAMRIDDKELLDLIYNYGYTKQQCAKALGTNEAYVAIKCDLLIEQGYELYPQEYDSDFWKR